MGGRDVADATHQQRPTHVKANTTFHVTGKEKTGKRPAVADLVYLYEDGHATGEYANHYRDGDYEFKIFKGQPKGKHTYQTRTPSNCD